MAALLSPPGICQPWARARRCPALPEAAPAGGPSRRSLGAGPAARAKKIGQDGCRRRAWRRNAVDLRVAEPSGLNGAVEENDVSLAGSVAVTILGGGKGEGLHPLTKYRAEAAVTVGGIYRMIDIPISNCINSGMRKIFVLTQYNSTSLNRHIAKTYNAMGGGGMGTGFSVEVLAAARTPTESDWFKGTADAVRHYSAIFKDSITRNLKYIMILSGDHLYRMDYLNFLKSHRDSRADITIACATCAEERASEYGLMKLDGDNEVIDFAEKPVGAERNYMKTDTTKIGLSAREASERPFLASMGIYIFNKQVLLDLLNDPNANDFATQVIPAAKARGYSVKAYPFADYWEDIGNVKSFFDANLALNQDPPPFDFYKPGAQMYTCPHRGPPTQLVNCKISESTLSDGCRLEQCTIKNSIVGLRTYVGTGSQIKGAVLMGADFLQTDEQRALDRSEGRIPLGVGEGCVIENAIVDKNARIGDGCIISNARGLREFAHANGMYYIRRGITIIPKDSVLPNGIVI